ncbi:hypothetical protein [Deinococcus maricopensis]|uniref:hypothetical protein n=1 Tax=Deinococcus maricopensis TaxID=309887 RepID=UPI0005C24432|nr:hypothetical protein [Deinococcus maricopensis]
MDHWAELVELFEYKVADLLADRLPRGGRRSVGELRDLLIGAPLDSALLRRFLQTDRQWRQYTRVSRTAPVVSSSPSTPLGHWEATSRPEDAEQRVMQALAQAAWRERLRGRVARQADTWTREPGRVTLRALHALNVNLERGGLKYAVPAEDDPLVSLGNPETATRELHDLLTRLLEPGGLERARSMTTEIAHNPYPRDPNDADREARIRALDREPLSHEERTAMIRRILGERGERPPTERAQIRAALGRGLQFFEDLIPPSQGGRGDGLPTVAGILHAQNADRRITEVDTRSSTLATRLYGPGEVRWHGLHVTWQATTGGAWQLMIDQHALDLTPQPGKPATIASGSRAGPVYAATDGTYLLLVLDVPPATGLQALLARARTVSALLESEDDYLNLRLARAVAQRFREGRVDAASVSAATAVKYHAAPPDTLLAFARKGADSLIARAEQLDASTFQDAFQMAAMALGCPPARAAYLLELLRQAVDPPALVTAETAVRTGQEVLAVTYRDEPITVEVAGRPVTLLSNYNGDLVVALPGMPAAPVRDLLVVPLPTGGLLVARQSARLMIGFQPRYA